VFQGRAVFHSHGIELFPEGGLVGNVAGWVTRWCQVW
jgi:hypothetical protein